MLDFFAHAIEFTRYEESGGADEYRGTKKNPFRHGLLFPFKNPSGNFVRTLKDPAGQEREDVNNNFFGVHATNFLKVFQLL